MERRSGTVRSRRRVRRPPPGTGKRQAKARPRGSFARHDRTAEGLRTGGRSAPPRTGRRAARLPSRISTRSPASGSRRTRTRTCRPSATRRWTGELGSPCIGRSRARARSEEDHGADRHPAWLESGAPHDVVHPEQHGRSRGRVRPLTPTTPRWKSSTRRGARARRRSRRRGAFAGRASGPDGALVGGCLVGGGGGFGCGGRI
jgi:hypothetical protein